MTKKIMLDFQIFTMTAELFDTPVADSLYQSLPQTISLTHWGREMYGSVSGRHGSHAPVPHIPVGGLAYTDQGSYFCVFFGQQPAWPVEHIGRVTESDLSALDQNRLTTLTISASTGETQR
ncbi:MAG: hypothetical protein JXX14_25420 [Deltaproteobacteria bacterium]|nr:hypothetical protein [Deltaproteobacteria bacterium]